MNVRELVSSSSMPGTIPVRLPILLTLFGLPLLAAVAGCRSRFVDTTIENQGAESLQVIEVDYPSASFGVSVLAAHQQFHYRFKVQGSGNLKLEYTDGQGQVHSTDGPELRQGQEGRLDIVIDQTGRVTWRPALTSNPE